MLCADTRHLIKMSHMLGKSPQESTDVSARQKLSPHLDLPFSHDLVHDLVVVLVEHALVVTLLVAQDAEVLGALQLDLKLLEKEEQRL